MQNKLPIPGKVTFLGGPLVGDTVEYDHFRLDVTVDGALLGDPLWMHDYIIDLESLKFYRENKYDIISWTADFDYVGPRRPWVPMQPCYE